MWCALGIAVLGGRSRQMPGTCWPASLDKLAKPVSQWETVWKNLGWHRLTSSLHLYKHAHIQPFKWSYTLKCLYVCTQCVHMYMQACTHAHFKFCFYCVAYKNQVVGQIRSEGMLWQPLHWLKWTKTVVYREDSLWNVYETMLNLQVFITYWIPELSLCYLFFCRQLIFIKRKLQEEKLVFWLPIKILQEPIRLLHQLTLSDQFVIFENLLTIQF